MIQNIIGFMQLPENDRTALSQLVTLVPQGKIFVEIGSWCGESSVIIGQHCKNIGAKLYCIDMWTGSIDTELEPLAKEHDVFTTFKNNIEAFGLSDVIEPIRLYSDNAVKSFEPNSIDFLFIDGDHRYCQISKDIENYYPLVKQGGIISGHDLNSLTFDERYINQDFVNGTHHGVTKAVTEFFKNKPLLHNNSIWYHKK